MIDDRRSCAGIAVMIYVRQMDTEFGCTVKLLTLDAIARTFLNKITH
jgi:hypothetical protein